MLYYNHLSICFVVFKKDFNRRSATDSSSRYQSNITRQKPPNEFFFKIWYKANKEYFSYNEVFSCTTFLRRKILQRFYVAVAPLSVERNSGIDGTYIYIYFEGIIFRFSLYGFSLSSIGSTSVSEYHSDRLRFEYDFCHCFHSIEFHDTSQYKYIIYAMYNILHFNI